MQASLENITVLVVEDHEDTRELMRALLQQYGANVTVAASVDTALASCRSAPPHLVISDIRLGASDGFALIEQIREYNKEYRGFIPAIALTGFDSPGDKERALASGFNAFLQKPFEPEQLINAATSLLSSQSDSAA